MSRTLRDTYHFTFNSLPSPLPWEHWTAEGCASKGSLPWGFITASWLCHVICFSLPWQRTADSSWCLRPRNLNIFSMIQPPVFLRRDLEKKKKDTENSSSNSFVLLPDTFYMTQDADLYGLRHPGSLDLWVSVKTRSKSSRHKWEVRGLKERRSAYSLLHSFGPGVIMASPNCLPLGCFTMPWWFPRPCQLSLHIASSLNTLH